MFHNFNDIVSLNWRFNESSEKLAPFPPHYLISFFFFFLLAWFIFLFSHWIPNSHPNRKHIHMQNPPKRQPQLWIISCCFSKSDANFMQIASANMYINLALRVWCRALQGLTNQTETEGRKCCWREGGESTSFYCITPYHAETTAKWRHVISIIRLTDGANCCRPLVSIKLGVLIINPPFKQMLIAIKQDL